MRRHNAVTLVVMAVAAGPTVTMAQRPANAPPLVPVRLNVDGHQTFIPGAERRPLRLWLHVSENDLGVNTAAEQMRNWVIANNRMADVLKAKRYPYQFVFSEASGHVERSVQLQTLPEAFEWVWKGYK